MSGTGRGAHTPRGDEHEEIDVAPLERRFMVMAGADVVFDMLADPVRLPSFVPVLTLDDSTAIEGDVDADADLAARDGAPAADFIADRRTRTITWRLPNHDRGGTIAVTERTANIADVAITVELGDDDDGAAIGRLLDEVVANIRRLATALR
jgi:hypothetical protein